MDIKSNSFFYIFISVVLLLIAILQYDLWFSNTGFIKYQALKKSVISQQKEVKHKSQTNVQLYSEVVSLRQNSEVLESLARENMGLIKQEEVFYSVK
ncbi:FtsB family cell division protein [Francisella tularensis]|uniref:FtsB family cell division protein n=1 Tax=Francisella tularensis TaxID=263 RepID=UPI00028DA61A|nr:septum formation initiator family protein [Francisella tularensis]AJI62552.1 septum formation initiator family protein [Francisella tularensis subsp. tularensis]EKM91497.1 putative septum formation initiator [Francisella tularensis subsp. tularensis 80700103]KFJ64965.1 septum formation initiator family protein [Francisella tularensis]MBK2015087.1 septum formation initiator family protein [Francisella tularensis subsp. tularensis]MBK2016801.1 septum formation initiator family protein [Franci